MCCQHVISMLLTQNAIIKGGPIGPWGVLVTGSAFRRFVLTHHAVTNHLVHQEAAAMCLFRRLDPIAVSHRPSTGVKRAVVMFRPFFAPDNSSCDGARWGRLFFFFFSKPLKAD